jgi:hypothetical protein
MNNAYSKDDESQHEALAYNHPDPMVEMFGQPLEEDNNQNENAEYNENADLEQHDVESVQQFVPAPYGYRPSPHQVIANCMISPMEQLAV